MKPRSDLVVWSGRLVTERKTFAERGMIICNPAKAIKDLTSEQVTGLEAALESTFGTPTGSEHN